MKFTDMTVETTVDYVTKVLKKSCESMIGQKDIGIACSILSKDLDSLVSTGIINNSFNYWYDQGNKKLNIKFAPSVPLNYIVLEFNLDELDDPKPISADPEADFFGV